MKKSKLPEKKTAPPISRLLISITFLLLFILLTRTPNDADMWWHLRSGEEMVTKGQILLKDIFSYTRYGANWVNAFWLADIFLYLIFKLGGYFALAAFVSLMGLLTFKIVQKQMQGAPFLQAILLILAALTAAPIWTPRPQLFSFLLLAILDYWLFNLAKKTNARLWLLLPFFVLWANLHGGYIWGILLLIATLVGESLARFWDEKEKLPAQTLKKLALFSILSLFAVLLNPNGIALWRLPFHTLDVSLNIQEWHSPDFHQISVHPMLWMLFLLILALAKSRQKLKFSEIFKILGFAYLTFISQRNVAPFAIILLPVLSRQFSSLWDEEIAPRVGRLGLRLSADYQPKQLPLKITRLINGLLIIGITLVSLLNTYIQTRPNKVTEDYPVNAVKWIKEKRPEGKLFNSYNWGGYLIWTLHEYPVFIDGRADLYGEEMLTEWHQVVNASESAQSILDKWDVNLILLEPNQRIISELSQIGWELLYEDEMSVIYGR